MNKGYFQAGVSNWQIESNNNMLVFEHITEEKIIRYADDKYSIILSNCKIPEENVFQYFNKDVLYKVSRKYMKIDSPESYSVKTDVENFMDAKILLTKLTSTLDGYSIFNLYISNKY